MKFNKILYSIALILFSFSISGQNYEIVIDAGHGGRDPGNLKHYSKGHDEKHLNLDISKLVGSYIERNLKGVRVIYTRTSDKFVSLDDRVYIANRTNADYFISIHANSNSIKSIHGCRVHIHNGNFGESKNLAKKIVRQMSATAGRKNLGVQDSRQRGGHYFVLENTAMPAVLVECGFMTNPNEEKFLNSSQGKKLVALAIYRGLKDFLYNENSISESKNNTNNQTTNTTSVKPKDLFKVQIRASTEAIPRHRFKNLNMKVEEVYFPENVFKYKYYVGSGSSFSEAKRIQKTVIKKGFEGAFIVKN